MIDLKNNKNSKKLIPLGIAVLVALGLVFAGWGTVYAAQDAQPDDLLYPVKIAVDYLADLTATSFRLDGPVQDRDQDQGMVNVPSEVEDIKQYQYRKGEGWLVEEIAEPLLDDLDLTVDETLATTNMMTRTQEMSGTLTMTQYMSGTLTMTREVSGTVNGPGQCFGDAGSCPPIEIPLGYTRTYTSGENAPYQGDLDLIPQPEFDQPEPGLGFGDGKPPAEEVQEPEGNTPVGNSSSSGNSGATETDQKKGGK